MFSLGRCLVENEHDGFCMVYRELESDADMTVLFCMLRIDFSEVCLNLGLLMRWRDIRYIWLCRCRFMKRAGINLFTFLTSWWLVNSIRLT
jgi:hypothetical protein